MLSRQLKLKIVSTLIGLAVALIMGEVALLVYGDYVLSREEMDDGFIQYDPQLGWRLSRSWSGRHQHFDYDVTYSTDTNGLRRPIVSLSTSVKTGVLVLGDSFTFGLGVEDTVTFVSLLNQDQSGIQYVNAGMPGYAPDQQLLWLERVLRWIQVDRVLFVLYLGNDLIDIGRAYPVQAAYAKPYVELDANGDLQLRNIPVPHDAKPAALQSVPLASYISENTSSSWLRQLNLVKMVVESGLVSSRFAGDDSDLASDEMLKKMQPALRLFDAVINRMANLANRKLTLVLLPGASVINTPLSLSARYQMLLRDELVLIGEEQELDIIDLIPALSEARGELYYPHDGHLTVRGHRVVASALESKFKGR